MSNITTSPYVIALYVRLSIEDTRVESLSIPNQLRALHKYVDSMENVSDVQTLEYIDNGYSGTNFERPAIQELLEMVRQSAVSCIIVKDFSRFGRNSIEVGYFLERVFPLYGIRFISINDEFDSGQLHGDTGGINVAFKFLISEFYSRDLSTKTKSSKYIKMKRGEYQSTLCCYGYRKGSNGRLEIDEETAPNVRWIFSMASQGISNTQIIKALCEKQILTPAEYKASKGGKQYDISRCRHIWTRSTILRMLEDERYIGTYIVGKRKVIEVGGSHMRLKDESEWFKIPDHHPAIVDKQIFERANKTIRRFKCVRKNRTEYALRDKAFCGCCLHSLTRLKRKEPLFRCKYTEADLSASCRGYTIMESELETILYDIISKQAQAILGLDKLEDADGEKLQSAELADYEKKIAALNAQKRKLYEYFMLNIIDKESYMVSKTALDGELNRLKNIQSSLSLRVKQSQAEQAQKDAAAALAKNVIASDGLTTELVDALIDKVLVYPDNQVEIIWKTKDFCL